MANGKCINCSLRNAQLEFCKLREFDFNITHMHDDANFRDIEQQCPLYAPESDRTSCRGGCD